MTTIIDKRAYVAKFMNGNPIMIAMNNTDMEGASIQYRIVETWTRTKTKQDDVVSETDKDKLINENERNSENKQNSAIDEIKEKATNEIKEEKTTNEIKEEKTTNEIKEAKLNLCEVLFSHAKAASITSKTGLMSGADMFHLIDENKNVLLNIWQVSYLPGNVEIVVEAREAREAREAKNKKVTSLVSIKDDIIEAALKFYNKTMEEDWKRNKDSSKAVWCIGT